MRKLRVIAVENVYMKGIDEVVSAIACVYLDKKLQVYDTFGGLYHQKEYFDDFTSLSSLINRGKYTWSDFTIEKGQLITRDFHDNILVENAIIEAISPLPGKCEDISDITIKLFHQFLQRTNKDNTDILQELTSDLNTGKFKEAIQNIIKTYPIAELTTEDYELIVRTRIEGTDFISNKFKSFVSSPDPLKLEQMTHYFSRLFKLEAANYISFQAGEKSQ